MGEEYKLETLKEIWNEDSGETQAHRLARKEGYEFQDPEILSLYDYAERIPVAYYVAINNDDWYPLSDTKFIYNLHVEHGGTIADVIRVRDAEVLQNLRKKLVDLEGNLITLIENELIISSRVVDYELNKYEETQNIGCLSCGKLFKVRQDMCKELLYKINLQNGQQKNEK